MNRTHSSEVHHSDDDYEMVDADMLTPEDDSKDLFASYVEVQSNGPGQTGAWPLEKIHAEDSCMGNTQSWGKVDSAFGKKEKFMMRPLTSFGDTHVTDKIQRWATPPVVSKPFSTLDLKAWETHSKAADTSRSQLPGLSSQSDMDSDNKVTDTLLEKSRLSVRAAREALRDYGRQNKYSIHRANTVDSRIRELQACATRLEGYLTEDRIIYPGTILDLVGDKMTVRTTRSGRDMISIYHSLSQNHFGLSGTSTIQGELLSFQFKTSGKGFAYLRTTPITGGDMSFPGARNFRPQTPAVSLPNLINDVQVALSRLDSSLNVL